MKNKKELKIEELNIEDFKIEQVEEVKDELKRDFEKITLVTNFNDILKSDKIYSNLWSRVVEQVVNFDKYNKPYYNFTSQTLQAIKILLENLTIFTIEEDFKDLTNSQLKRDCKIIFEGIFNNKITSKKLVSNSFKIEEFKRTIKVSLKTFITHYIKMYLSDNNKIIVKFENVETKKEVIKMLDKAKFIEINTKNINKAIEETSKELLNILKKK